MLWALQEKGTPSPAQVTQTACVTMDMGGCGAPLPF
jgi:hypothetical protein